MADLRTAKLIKNTVISAGIYIAYALTGFICRSIFIHQLGLAVGGVSGLFGSILNLFSLAELGFGSAITCCLYKPVAEHDEKHIAALIHLLRRAYWMVMLSITAMGLCMLPFIGFFIKNDAEIPFVRLYFLLYIARSVCSYAWAYKTTLIAVHQEGWRINIISNVLLIVQTVAQSIFLTYTSSFAIYLLLQIVTVLMTNLLVSRQADKLYPYVRKYKAERVEPEERKSVFALIRASALDRISYSIKTATDNMLVSKFIGVVTVALMDNYRLVISTITIILNYFFNNAMYAVGNLNATEDSRTCYRTLLELQLVTAWIFGFFTTCMWTVFPSFIALWMGADYLLPDSLIFLLLLNFFLNGLTTPVSMFFTSLGYVRKFPLLNLCNVALNLVISLALVKPLGVEGVYIGTVVSFLLSQWWLIPRILIKNAFGGDYRPYVSRYILFLAADVAAALVCHFVCRTIALSGIWAVLATGVVSVALFNAVFVLLLGRTAEFRAVFKLGRMVLSGFFSKLRRRGRAED